MKEPKSLLKSAGAMSLATLLSRILGLARDQVLSYYFGAGLVTDAFLAAFRIPNLLRDLFAEGALSSAFVPTFTAERVNRGDEAASRLASRIVSALLVILGALTLVILVFAPWILRVYVAGFSDEKLELTITMTRILSPFLLFVALAAVAMGMLNTYGRFFLPALAPAWFNVASILGVVILSPTFSWMGIPPGLSLAVGSIVGGLLQFLVQVPAMRREGFRFRFEWAPSDPGVRRVASLMLPATFGLAATQINILVDTVLASRYGDGPITWLSIAFRLIQLPIGLFGVAIATANLTRVSRDAARGDTAALRSNLATALRTAAFLTLPATAGLIALRVPIVRVLFEHGRFTAASTVATASAVLCYALGLYAYAVTKIQVPTFYALGDTRLPVLASATAVTVKIAANFAFLALLPRLSIPPFLGLALSTSLAAWTNFFLLSGGLRRRIGRLEGLGVVSSSFKIAALSVVVGAGSFALLFALERVAGGGGLAGECARLLAVCAFGGAIALLLARLLGIPEGHALVERVRALASRNRGR
jgi:putative peptidoglycan lipid II flippase